MLARPQLLTISPYSTISPARDSPFLLSLCVHYRGFWVAILDQAPYPSLPLLDYTEASRFSAVRDMYGADTIRPPHPHMEGAGGDAHLQYAFYLLFA